MRANLGGSLAIQTIGIVTGTLLARGLGPHDRGVIAAMVLWPTLVVAIGDCGIGSALAFFSAQERLVGRSYVRFADGAAAAISVVLIPIGLLVAYLGLSEAGVEPVSLGLVLAAVFIPAALISRYIGSLAQGLLRFGVFYAIRISMNLSIAVVLGIELLVGQMSVKSAVAAYLGGLVAMTRVILGVQRLLAKKSDGERPALRKLASYGLRSLFGALYPVETLFVDQIIVAISLGPHELGLYAAALAFTTLPRVLADAIATATFPHMARATNPRRSALRFLGAGMGVLIACGAVLTPLMPWLVVGVFGQRFSDAVVPAELLMWGSILFGLRRIAGDAVRGLGAPGRASAIEVATWPVMIGVLAVATRGGLTAVAGGLMGVQALALSVSLMVLGWTVRRRESLMVHVDDVAADSDPASKPHGSTSC